MRGELPTEVKSLEDEIVRLETRISNFKAEIDAKCNELAAEKAKIEESKIKIARYKEQINNVSNNGEYDLLSKEIEFQTLEIELSEKHINEFNRVIDAKTAEIASIKQAIEDNKHILEDKKHELDEIVTETRQEEDRLRDKAHEIEPRIDERTLAAFKRIRKNARNGLAVVYIQRNACGGCFNRIPPQRQLEIKMHKKIIVCEYCGRIMIDPALAGVSEAEGK